GRGRRRVSLRAARVAPPRAAQLRRPRPGTEGRRPPHRGRRTRARGGAAAGVTAVPTEPRTVRGGIAPAELFDPEFLRALEGLRIVARAVPAGGRHAEQRSRARGAGIEFTDVRPYVPGDDFRSIDWHVLQRFDKVFIRLFLQ